jgi:hypothetical protein
MTIPYTYLIKCIPTGEVYYGVRYARGCNPSELWKTYFTSSKHVATRIQLFGKESFLHEIRKVFETGNKARLWEDQVLRKMSVIDDPKWLNKNYGMMFEVRPSPLLGKKLVFVYSLNQYKWIEHPLAEVIVSKGLGVMKGPGKSKEHGQKVSASMKGKKKSPEHVNNIVESFNGNPNNRGWIVYTNGSSNIRIRPGESPPAGYHKGTMLKGKSTPNKNIGKSYEEIYGIDKAIQIKSKRSNHLKQNNPSKKIKGKTYEEMYDANTVTRLKEARRKSGKKNNKSYEIYKDNSLVFSGNRLGAVEFLYSNYKGSKANNLYNTDWLSTQNIRVDIRYTNR